MSLSVASCFDLLAQGQELELLAPPCRTVVIVYSAWGIIENGGFRYFFESSFPGDPEFDVFTQAFRSVGLDDIAQRFSELVSLFPFQDAHTFPAQREEFLESAPAAFIASMTQLETLIYAHDDIEKTLNEYLQRCELSFRP